MTREQRILLRHLINQAKRQQLAGQKKRAPQRNQAARRASYLAYYQRHRERILAQRRTRNRAA